MLIKQIAAYTKFTTTEQTIAEYILANTSSMENISIQELAKRTFTSNASIIRFAQKMGFRGFKEFKIQLLKSIEQLDGPQKDINPNIPFEDHSPLMKISEDMMHLTQQAIKETYQLLNEAQLMEMTKHLYNAKRIFLFAAGDSQIRAESFQNKLWKINKYAILAKEREEWALNAANLLRDDCAFFISYDAKAMNDLVAARLIKERGIPILLLTSYPDSELGKLADVIITVSRLETKETEKISTYSSQAAFEYILNVLFSTLYQMEYQENRQRQLWRAEVLQQYEEKPF
ncbi:MurR/RpiR family transcriptional regulator [Niallia sp. FSL R7-0271]|uniref:MurR/RpiR family transcriptional regulator n=1 Tax=Niallia sp. FSL R7-0271 TaxID=2921678 RepID=UPI0030FBA536